MVGMVCYINGMKIENGLCIYIFILFLVFVNDAFKVRKKVFFYYWVEDGKWYVLFGVYECFILSFEWFIAFLGWSW